MLGCSSGFFNLIKKNLLVERTHCFIHQEALMAKRLPRLMNCNLITTVKNCQLHKKLGIEYTAVL